MGFVEKGTPSFFFYTQSQSVIFFWKWKKKKWKKIFDSKHKNQKTPKSPKVGIFI